jgi:hypothetical protein
MSENVLAEARRAENARFPRHAAFRKRSQITTSSSHLTSQSQLCGNESLGGETIDAALNAPDDWIVGAGLSHMMDLNPSEISNFDIDCFYAEDADGLAWDLPLCPLNV